MQCEPVGIPDTDVSIIVPKNSKELTNLSEEEINEISLSNIEEWIFYEKYRGASKRCGFRSLKMGDWYFLWIQGISSWIAIYFYTGYSEEGYNSTVAVDITRTRGPYDIGTQGSKIVKEYYNSSIPLEDIKKTSPEKLRNL